MAHDVAKKKKKKKRRLILDTKDVILREFL